MLFRGCSKVVQRSPMSAPARSPDRSLDRVLRGTSGDAPKTNPRHLREGSLRSFREGSLMRFRELSRGSKIQSKHPKEAADRPHPSPKAPPRCSGQTRASGLERESHTPPARRVPHEQGQPGSRQRRKGGRYKESRPAGGRRGRRRLERHRRGQGGRGRR